jgi:hypothetical protein
VGRVAAVDDQGVAVAYDDASLREVDEGAVELSLGAQAAQRRGLREPVVFRLVKIFSAVSERKKPSATCRRQSRRPPRSRSSGARHTDEFAQ